MTGRITIQPGARSRYVQQEDSLCGILTVRETIVVALIISPVFIIQPHILQNGTNSVAALIALRYGEATPFGTSALMAAGLALFLITLVVNFAASSVIARTRSGAATDE